MRDDGPAREGTDHGPLRIALLAYRGKPHVGGQGVYIRQLAKALTDLGHSVEVLGGQPYPEVPEGVELVELPSLDIYNEHFPARTPGFWEIKNWKDMVEVLSFSAGQFPEPLAFSLRAWDHLKNRTDDFDIVHDNQTLGYGLLAIEAAGLPVLATIHHPITVDRRLELEHAPNWRKRWSLGRWYSFTHMQTQVARRLQRVVTVSENSYKDIVTDHKVDPDRMAIVPVGVDPDVFRPLDDVERIPGRLVTTASADVTMKGLRYLLEALAKVRTERDDLHLVIIGKEKPGGPSSQTIDRLGLRDCIEFVTGVPERRIVELYSEAELAVVPSLYEGFSLPAIEAMSCGCPLVATTGGAVPEVVGPDGETAMLVPPGDSDALAVRIKAALADPEGSRRIGLAGRERVKANWSWRHTAERTVEQYRMRLGQIPPHRGGVS
jgi:glycosyltransferase involved in cell wall biosynthesis